MNGPGVGPRHRGRSEQWAEYPRSQAKAAGPGRRAVCVTRTHTRGPHGRAAAKRAPSESSVQGVDGGAMHAIYQHRTDNEVPRRLPVVEDADRS